MDCKEKTFYRCKKMSETNSDYTACVNAKVADGMSREDAEAACKTSESETAEKAVPKPIRSTREFEKYINEAVEKALDGYKEELIQRSIDAVTEVKNQLQAQTISAVKKAITPETKTVMYKEDLAQAMREISLENSKHGKTSVIETRQATGEYTTPPSTMPDVRKRVNNDMEKMIEHYNSTSPAVN
jgi:O-acetyl-ADP-ribose deacetylase (regulator of RNase III)